MLAEGSLKIDPSAKDDVMEEDLGND